MFTNIDTNTLVSWFVTVVVFLYGSTKLYMNRTFRAWYDSVHGRKSDLLPWMPSTRTFGIVWLVISGCFIASMTLWTMNYHACYNTYYIVIIVMALAQLTFLAAWGPFFIKWKKPAAAFFTALLAVMCGVTALVLMCITLTQFTTAGSDICLADKMAGIFAVCLWAIPHLWYLYVLYFSWVMWYMRDKYNWEKFRELNRTVKNWKNESEYGGDNSQYVKADMETGLLPKKNRVNLKNSH